MTDRTVTYRGVGIVRKVARYEWNSEYGTSATLTDAKRLIDFALDGWDDDDDRTAEEWAHDLTWGRPGQ